MKQNKVAKNYRFDIVLIKQLEKVADEIGCSNTFVIEQALKRFFVEYENCGTAPKIFERQLAFPDDFQKSD